MFLCDLETPESSSLGKSVELAMNNLYLQFWKNKRIC